MPATLEAILSQAENANGDRRPIEIIDVRAARQPFQTHAESTLRRILAERGEDHLRFVLATLTQSENNAGALVGPVIEAVSEIVAAHPYWAERTTEWLSAFDKIELIDLYERAKALKSTARGPSKTRAVQMLLADRLAAVMGQPEPKYDLFSEVV